MRKNTYETIQKKLILDYLKGNSDKFVNANDILEYLMKNNQKVGLTTIYRYLNALLKEGLLRVETLNSTRCFQYIKENCKNHFHLKCEKCGKLKHVECPEMEEFSNHIRTKHGFNIDMQNTISGVCKTCLAKERKK